MRKRLRDLRGELRLLHHARAFDHAERQIGPAAIPIDRIHRCDGVHLRHARHRGEDFALTAIRQRMQHGHRTRVIAIREHVRVEDDLDRRGHDICQPTDARQEEQ